MAVLDSETRRKSANGLARMAGVSLLAALLIAVPAGEALAADTAGTAFHRSKTKSKSKKGGDKCSKKLRVRPSRCGDPTPTDDTIRINWKPQRYPGTDRDDFVVPGMGRGEVVCRRDTGAVGTYWVRFFPKDQQSDTVMWSWADKAWRPTIGQDELSERAVRTAKRSRYSGRDFYEGFNKQNTAEFGVEEVSRGTFTGIISQQPDRDGSGGSGPRPTTFRVSWYWNFGDGNPRCFVTGEFNAAQHWLTINWRNNQWGSRDRDSTSLPGIGKLEAVCNPNEQRLRFTPADDSNATMRVTRHEGSDTATDRLTASGSPIDYPLPNNGMLNVTVSLQRENAQDPSASLIFSSEYVVNDNSNNKCFVAGAS